MLILDAKENESIFVGAMEMVILHISPTKVKLGFKGPREIEVMRAILLKKESENERH